MHAEQAQRATQLHADMGTAATEDKAQPAKTSKGRWRLSAWLLGCFGGGGLLIVAVLAWGYWQLGSFANIAAYVNGERLLVDPRALSFGTGPRGEERDVRFTIWNR